VSPEVKISPGKSSFKVSKSEKKSEPPVLVHIVPDNEDVPDPPV
jgi:hypothetical protein